jgi:hypothetical protein
MSRYVLINKPELIIDYENSRDYLGNPTIKQMPLFTRELREWLIENQHQIKNISTTLMAENYRYAVGLEFHDEREALVFRLRWL